MHEGRPLKTWIVLTPSPFAPITIARQRSLYFVGLSPLTDPLQCCAINVGFELHIVIESKLSISNIGFDFEMGKFGHFDFDIDIISIQYQYQ